MPLAVAICPQFDPRGGKCTDRKRKPTSQTDAAVKENAPPFGGTCSAPPSPKIPFLRHFCAFYAYARIEKPPTGLQMLQLAVYGSIFVKMPPIRKVYGKIEYILGSAINGLL